MPILGRRYDTGFPVRIESRNGHISQIETLTASTPEEAARYERLPWVAPGFVDLQINGYRGQEFNDLELTPEKVARVSLDMDRDGVTKYLATCTTHSFELFAHAFRAIGQAIETVPAVTARVAGIHMEGPYIATEDGPRGAHPRQHCRPPDWDEFQRLQAAAGGHIRLLTLSPEYDGSAEFIAKVVTSGVLVAIGHTAANSDQIRAAVDAGARLSTHLGNGAHGQIRRHPNYIWDQLAEDRLVASLITDGHHLPPSVVQSFVRAKTPERCVLVSDITGMGGMPPGWYSCGLGEVEVLEDGRLVVAGQRQYLAGAALSLPICIANVMRFAGVGLATAIDMASRWPARLVGLPAAGLAIGSPADLVLFDLPHNDREPLAIRATFQAGEQVFGNPA